MIKKETILSVFDKKLTLLEYLKEIKKGLEDSTIESFSCDQVDETHVKFAINFADGTKYETDAIELPTGPQGETGPTPQIEVSASAETLAPNESATASVTQGGTAEAPTIAIAFGIPKGDKGEGAKLYMHKVAFGSDGNFKAILYTTEVTPFTINTLAKWLKDNGFTSRAKAKSFEINNQVMSVSTTQLYLTTGIYSSDGVNIMRFETIINIVAGTGFSNISYSDSISSLHSDVVIEL